MIRNAILDEVRAIRDSIAQEHNYNVDAIFDMFRKAAASSDREHVNLSAAIRSATPQAAQEAVLADEATPRR